MSEAADIELLESRYKDSLKKARNLEDQGKPVEAAEAYRSAANFLKRSAERTDQEEQEKLEGVVSMRRRAKQLEENGIPETSDEKQREKNTETESGEGLEHSSKVPDLDLSDYKGQTELVEQVRSDVVTPWRNQEYYEEAGISVVNGIIMYGKPGTGKTFLAKCLAGELGFTFFEPDTAEATSKYVNESAEIINQIFSEALESQPSIVFLDELDALAPDRGSNELSQSQRNAVNQLLQSLNKIQGEDVVFIGSTNEVGLVDSAVKGSHRVQQMVEVGVPDSDARREVFKKYAGSVDVDWSWWDWDSFDQHTAGWTPAQVKELAEKCVRRCTEEAVHSEEKRPEDVQLRYKHFREVVKNREEAKL